jgi:choline dehydrogenase-like flavoprotein
VAQALFPGGALPAAEGDGGVAVVEPVDRLAAAAGPRARAAIRLALRAFEWSSFPRSFSRLPAARRAAHLARLEGGRGRLRRDLAITVKTLACLGWARDPEVRAAVGVDGPCGGRSAAAGAGGPAGVAGPAGAAGCRLRAGAAPPPSLPPLDRAGLRAPDGVERCDVVVVGSGAGGAAVARALAERGLDVIVVEEGDYHDASDYSSDPLHALPTLYRDGGLTFCEGSPAIPLPVGRCVGGTTVINSGTCLRTPADVLAGWRDELGIAWAADLDAEFEALERDLRVRPVDPDTAGRNAQLCRAGAEALGVSHGPLPRNAGEVECCASCPTGCALDAKQAMHVSELPRAVAAGARVRAGMRVQRLLVEGGRAVGIAGRRGRDDAADRRGTAGRIGDGGSAEGRGDASGDGRGRYEVRARAVVLAAGALGTPELLLRQRLPRSPHLGRHLRIHPACWVGARFDEPVRGWEGVMQSWYVDEWQDRGLFLEATFTPFAFGAHWLRGAGAELVDRLAAYDCLGVVGVHLSERGEGRVRVTRGGRLRVTYRLRADDARDIRYGIARAADVHFAAGAREVYPQVGRVAALAPGEQVDRVERARVRPGELRLEAFHPLGTARMSARPGDGVVGLDGQSHDVPGLYVADASVLPTSLKVNPMLTIMACARRIATGLAERLA